MKNYTITPNEQSFINKFVALSIPATDFVKVMCEKYDYFYYQCDGDGYDINDVLLFDAILSQRGTAIRNYIDEVVKARMDIMSSDRECAAFIAAMRHYVEQQPALAVVPDELLEEYCGAGCTLGRCKNTKYIQSVIIASPWGEIRMLYRGSRRGAFEEIKKQFDGFEAAWDRGNHLYLYFACADKGITGKGIKKDNAEIVVHCQQLEAAGLRAAAIEWDILRKCFAPLPLALPAPKAATLTDNDVLAAAARIRANYEEMKTQAAAETTPTAAPVKNSDMLQDWGEKIGGARKDEAQSYNREGNPSPVKNLKFGLTCYTVNISGERVMRWYLKISPRRYTRSLFIDFDGTREEAEQLFMTTHPNFDNYYKFDIYQIGYERKYIVEAKRVKIQVATFTSLDEAREYMNSEKPAADLAAAKAARAPEETKQRAAALVVRNSINRPRITKDYTDGRNITPEEFANTFALRAVEFGNWMTADDRQTSINECYNSFSVLAELLGIERNQIGRGTLAAAFGARGAGKANAHYESGKHVINLTRTRGAGSLAHEWAHSIDFDGGINNNLSRTFYCMGYSWRSKEAGSYWGRECEQFARAFETAIYYKLQDAGLVDDYLVNIKEGCKVYPTKDENQSLAPIIIENIKTAL